MRCMQPERAHSGCVQLSRMLRRHYVEVDHLNLLLLTKGRNTIESYFDANGEACIQPNALRIHGKFTESIDWDDVKQRFAITTDHPAHAHVRKPLRRNEDTVQESDCIGSFCFVILNSNQPWPLTEAVPHGPSSPRSSCSRASSCAMIIP